MINNEKVLKVSEKGLNEYEKNQFYKMMNC